MRLKNIIYILLLALVLMACGKAEDVKQEESKIEKEDLQGEKEALEESETEEEETVAQETSTNDSNQKSAETSSQKKKESGQNAKEESGQKTENSNNNSSQNSSQKPSNTTTQKPSNNTTQNSNQGTTQTPAKKPVKRVSEEVKSDVVPYKYGITQYDVTTNYYTLFSDDSKELLYSDSYTVYDSTNYSATDSQLKGEADSNASKYTNYYQEVLRLVNEIRAEAGVAPLTLDTTLCKAASMRALEMDYGNQMSHTRPNGKDCFSVLEFYGISLGRCGENIAAGQTSASSVVNGWKNSPGHYQNMINVSYTKLGVGYSASGVGDYGYYWCQLFTN